MFNNIKVSLTVTVPGIVIDSQSSSTAKDGVYNTMYVKDNKGNSDKITFITSKNKSINQVIKICQEAYNTMIDPNIPIEGISMFAWKNLTPVNRLWLHLVAIANDMRGKVASYTVFED